MDKRKKGIVKRVRAWTTTLVGDMGPHSNKSNSEHFQSTPSEFYIRIFSLWRKFWFNEMIFELDQLTLRIFAVQTIWAFFLKSCFSGRSFYNHNWGLLYYCLSSDSMGAKYAWNFMNLLVASLCSIKIWVVWCHSSKDMNCAWNFYQICCHVHVLLWVSLNQCHCESAQLKANRLAWNGLACVIRGPHLNDIFLLNYPIRIVISIPGLLLFFPWMLYLSPFLSWILR